MAKNNILRLTDANGLVIETTMQDIMDSVRVADLDGDVNLNMQDSQNPLTTQAQKQIVDSKGNQVDVSKLLDAVQKDKTKMPIACDVLIEVTHSGENTNSVSYHSDSMEKDAPSFMFPFKKPLIKNHDMWEEPIGRVRESSFGPSEFTDRDTVNVTFRVYDQDAIVKFLDGRYSTVSIGGSPKKVSCNICGKDILKDGKFKFCGHWRGEVYNNQKAVWSCRDIEYNEVSVVNNPADKWAQVKKITLVYPEDENKVGDNDMNKPVTDAEGNLISQILGDDNPPAATKTEDGAPPATENPEGIKDNNDNPPAADPPAEDEKDVKIKDLEGQVSTLTAEKTTLETKVSDLEKEKETLDNEKTELNDKLVIADAESKAARDQSLRMATKYKELLVSRVKDLNTVTKGDLTDEALNAMSIKELTDMAADLVTKVPVIHKTPAPVTNPGVVDNNNDPNVVKDDDDNTTKKLTTADYEKVELDIISGMVK